VLVSGRKFGQLPGQLIPALLIERGSLKTVTADQYHFAAMRPGFLLGGSQ
jgi:hypothetical protein